MILKPYLKKKKIGIVPRAHVSVPLNETLMIDEPFPVMLIKECLI